MDKILPLFPLNARVNKADVISLVITIVIYAVAAVIFGFIMGILSPIPVINILAGIIGLLAEIYMVAGIVLAVYTFIV